MHLRAWLAAPLALVSLALVLPTALAHNGDAPCVEDIQLTISQEEQRVVLRWDPVPDATVLHVHRARDGAEPIDLAELGGDATTFTDENVPNGVIDYTIGIDGHPRDADCQQASLHMHGPPPPVQCVEELAAEARPDGSVRLTWTPVRADFYELMRAKGDDTLAPIGQIPGFEEEFIDASGLEPGASYRYALAANGFPTSDLECPEATVTAVPFFPGVVLMVVPLVAAVAVYAWLLRQR